MNTFDLKFLFDCLPSIYYFSLKHRYENCPLDKTKYKQFKDFYEYSHTCMWTKLVKHVGALWLLLDIESILTTWRMM